MRITEQLLNYGTAIKVVRKSKRMTQKDLATALGVAQGFISLIETGERKPSLDTLERICRHLGVPMPLLSLHAADQSDLHGITPQRAKLLSEFLLDTLHPNKADESQP